MATTAKGLRYPAPPGTGIPANVPQDLKNLADDTDSLMATIRSGTAAARPTGRWVDDIYRATDTGVVSVWNGTAWVNINTPQPVDAAAGTASLRTLGTGAQQAAAGNDARLSDQRTPTDNSVTAAKVHTSLKPSSGAAAATEALRAIGTGTGQVAAGSDARIPTQGENDALVGTSGTPSSTNKFVTNADARLSDLRTPLDASVTLAKIAAGTTTRLLGAVQVDAMSAGANTSDTSASVTTTHHGKDVTVLLVLPNVEVTGAASPYGAGAGLWHAGSFYPAPGFPTTLLNTPFSVCHVFGFTNFSGSHSFAAYVSMANNPDTVKTNGTGLLVVLEQA